jgi:hypothetical protein
MSDQLVLPEKCCSTCGFLYGVGNSAIDRSNATFDPDLIRAASYPDPFSPNKGGFAQGCVTSVPYTLHRVWEEAGSFHVGNPEARHYTWAFVRSINCYHVMFRLITVSPFRQSRAMGDEELEEAEAQYLPINLDTVTTEIRRDRNDCKGYFRYHPGFTAVEHVNMQLEETRFERAQRTAESLNRATWITSRATVLSAIFAVVSVVAAIVAILVTLFGRH